MKDSRANQLVGADYDGSGGRVARARLNARRPPPSRELRAQNWATRSRLLPARPSEIGEGGPLVAAAR